MWSCAILRQPMVQFYIQQLTPSENKYLYVETTIKNIFLIGN